IDITAPQAEFLGLTIPDPKLRWNEAGQHSEFGEIDWSEFQRVLKGHGPCNRERLEARRRAHEEGAWVRDAAIAHEHKHAGSIHASDARMAIEHARDVYTRRQEGVSIWVVPSSQIVASDPDDADA